MRLYFQHTAGRITNTDWQYAPVQAFFERSEYKRALHSGWLKNEYDDPFWFQARQVRYRLSALEEAKRHKIPSRIDFDVVSPKGREVFYQPIWERYLEYKGFDKDEDFRTLLVLDYDLKKIVEVFDNDELVAFSIIRIDPGPVSLQFAWNYHEPKLSLGKHTQRFEMEYLYSAGYDYNYVCPGYETTCLWKSKFPGFEFWTGTHWSQDKNLYEKLCIRDSEIKLADTLGELPLIDPHPNIKKLPFW